MIYMWYNFNCKIISSPSATRSDSATASGCFGLVSCGAPRQAGKLIDINDTGGDEDPLFDVGHQLIGNCEKWWHHENNILQDVSSTVEML